MAIGSGTDIAIEAADVVLMKSDVRDVLIAVDLSRATFRRIRLNYAFALLFNCIAIPIAMGVLYPGLRFQLPPWVAGLAMALSSVTVVISSLSLRLHRTPSFAPTTAPEIRLSALPEPQTPLQAEISLERLAHKHQGEDRIPLCACVACECITCHCDHALAIE